MKKIISISLPILLCTFLFFVRVHAQEAAQIETKSEPIELTVNVAYIPCEDPGDPQDPNNLCKPYPSEVPHPDPANIDHEYGLTAQGLPANTNIVVVGCIDTENGARCTTGDPALNTYLNSLAGGNQMNPDPTHQFKVLQTLEVPVKTDENGYLEVIVRSFTPQVTQHFFNGYYIEKDTAGGVSQPTSILITPLGGTQLSDFTFNTITPSLAPANQKPQSKIGIPFGNCPSQKINLACFETQCAKPRLCNDPKGRFFDTQSLEPIPEGEATLLDNLKKLFTMRNFVNPQKVKMNGEFNFWVPNGLYFLDVSQKPANHIWPITIDKVHPNYGKAYYCDPDVKDPTNQAAPLYTDQYSIVEQNKLVHCDVPLDPGTSTPYRSDVKTISFSMKREQNSTTSYHGQVTHPLTLITLKGEITKKEAGSTEADKFGFWSITINSKDYPYRANGVPDRLVAYYTKIDLTTMQPSAPIAGQLFEPLLTFIEGYAYDQSGQILPHAQVGYRQQATDHIVYITQTDSKGYFKIPTRYLPSFSYSLVFTPTGSSKSITLSTSQFYQKNIDYLKKDSVNLLTKTNKESLGSQLIQRTASSTQNTYTPQDKAKENQNTAPQPKSILIIVIIMTLLIISIGVALYMFVLKPKSPPLS